MEEEKENPNSDVKKYEMRWCDLAHGIAEELYRSGRRNPSMFWHEKEGVLVLYDGQYTRFRVEEIALLRQRLAERGVQEIGFSCFPDRGRYCLASWVMCFGVPRQRAEEIWEVFAKVLRDFWGKVARQVECN